VDSLAQCSTVKHIPVGKRIIVYFLWHNGLAVRKSGDNEENPCKGVVNGLLGLLGKLFHLWSPID